MTTDRGQKLKGYKVTRSHSVSAAITL